MSCASPISVRNSHLPASRPRHADARREHAIERAGIDLVEQRAAGARAPRTAGTSRRRRRRRTRPGSRSCPSASRRRCRCRRRTLPARPARPCRRPPHAGFIVRQPRVDGGALLRASAPPRTSRTGRCPPFIIRSGAAVIVTFCSRPPTICGATGSDTSASSWIRGAPAAADRRRPRVAPRPFGRTTATGTSPFLTSSSAAARSSSAPLPSASAVVRTRRRRLLLERLDDPAAQFAAVLVDDRDADTRRGVALPGCRTPTRRSRRTGPAAGTSAPARRDRACRLVQLIRSSVVIIP